LYQESLPAIRKESIETSQSRFHCLKGRGLTGTRKPGRADHPDLKHNAQLAGQTREFESTAEIPDGNIASEDLAYPDIVHGAHVLEIEYEFALLHVQFGRHALNKGRPFLIAPANVLREIQDDDISNFP
jgi:hypothetical protein